MTKIVYLDQNAWVNLAKGAWDEARYPREAAALATIKDAVKSGLIRIPLSFTNIYETLKVNVPQQRINLAQTQAMISGGTVFRNRRAILTETLSAYLATRFAIPRAAPLPIWFLSDLWFEAVADHTPAILGFDLSDAVVAHMRAEPAKVLLDYLIAQDEQTRLQSVREYTTASVNLLAQIEHRRAVASGYPLAIRKRAYSAVTLINELDWILATGRNLGLPWHGLSDIGDTTAKAIINDIPTLNAERELAVRLEDQPRTLTENDLRDMGAFAPIFPLADIVVAEKQFSNLARQSKLDRVYKTRVFTSIFDFSLADDILRGNIGDA